MPPSAYTATVLRRYEEFLAVEPEWRRLFEAAERPTPYQRHRWLRLCWELARPRPFARLRIILIRDAAGTLVMAGAFVIRLYRLVPTVEFLNSGTPQLDDLLWRASPDTAEQAALLLDTLARNSGFAPMLRVLRLRDGSPLRAAVASCGLRSRVRTKIPSAYVPLADFRDYEHYLSSLSHGLRSDHRRRLRRLAEQPGFSYAHETGPAAREAIRWSFATKREWLADRGRSAGWLSSGLVDRFLLSFLEASDDVPETWVSTFRLGERIMACAICFVERDVVYFSKIAYDPEFSSQSPGRTLTLKEVEQGFARGCTAFEMGPGTIEWKRRLTPAERIVTSERIWLR